MLEWTYTGVNTSVPGAGGYECHNYLSEKQRFWESFVMILVSTVILFYSVPTLKLPFNFCYEPTFGNIRRAFLCIHSLIFGIEIGFKFANRQLIFLLNPCHVITALQIIMLTAPHAPIVTAAFRFQVHMLNGPMLALLFPVVNTRFLQFEVATYYIQHILIIIIPLYMMRYEAVFNVEPLNDYSWTGLAMFFQTFYHFGVLQYFSEKTGVNLNNMLCPAPIDPFKGRHYRKAAVLHQYVLIPLHGKLLTILANNLFPTWRNEEATKLTTIADDNGAQMVNLLTTHREEENDEDEGDEEVEQQQEKQQDNVATDDATPPTADNGDTQKPHRQRRLELQNYRILVKLPFEAAELQQRCETRVLAHNVTQLLDDQNWPPPSQAHSVQRDVRRQMNYEDENWDAPVPFRSFQQRRNEEVAFGAAGVERRRASEWEQREKKSHNAASAKKRSISSAASFHRPSNNDRAGSGARNAAGNGGGANESAEQFPQDSNNRQQPTRNHQLHHSPNQLTRRNSDRWSRRATGNT